MNTPYYRSEGDLGIGQTMTQSPILRPLTPCSRTTGESDAVSVGTGAVDVDSIVEWRIAGLAVTYIYKTNRGCRTRSSTNASDQPDINLSAGPAGPHEGGYQAGRERGYSTECDIRGWLCIYYTFKHLNRFICYNYPVFRSHYSTRHVDISTTEKRFCYNFLHRLPPLFSVRWRSDATTRKLKYIARKIIPTNLTISHARLLS